MYVYLGSVCSYQGLPCRVQLVFGPAEQQGPGEDVKSLSSSLRAVVYLSLPQLIFIEGRAPQKPTNTTSRDVSSLTFFI